MSKLRKMLSLVLAAAMVLSMMLVPASAAQFKDADQITYTEEVSIAAGLGLFAGADGSFMPKETVTRAQMATIIVKMLHGAEADANSFKKIDGSFTDIRDFEGGWAEGYINWCASLGVVKGYGDGTFKPGKTVTAAEAVTMILNALKIDAGEGTWPVTVMAKAEEVKFFTDLKEKPAADKPLSREELAVVSLAGLQYSPEGKTGYIYDGKVYDSYMDALLIAGDVTKITPAANDTLATRVYELKTAEGFVVGNQSTGLEYTQLNGGRNFAIATGLDQVGHYVTVYYKELYESEDEPGVTYAVSDECVVVKVDETISSAREYKAAFGKTYSRNTGITMIDGEYNVSDVTGAIDGYVGGSAAPEGTYIIHKGNIVAYMEPVTKLISKVTYVDKTKGSESISLLGINDYQAIENNEDEDRVREYSGIAVDDYVVVTKAGSVWNLSPVTAVTGAITRTYTNEDGVPCVTMNGTGYAKLVGEYKISDLDNDIDRFDDYDAACKLYLTEDKEFIGWEITEGTGADLTRVRYLVGAYITKEKDSYGKETRNLYAQGMDMNGKQVAELIGVLKPDGTFVGAPGYADIDTAKAAITEGFYMVDELDVDDRDDKKLGILLATPVGLMEDYDEKTSPFFLGSNRWATSGTTSISFGADVVRFTAHICDTNCTHETHTEGAAETMAFPVKGTKYLTIDGGVGAELETAVMGSSFKYTTKSGEALKFLMLFSKNDTGAVYLQAMIFRTDTQSLTMSGDPIYFSARQLDKPAGTVPDGVLYEGYDPLTGEVMTLTFDDDTVGTISDLKNTTGKGFYEYSVEDGIATIGSQVTGTEANEKFALHDYTLTGVNGTTLLGTTSFSGSTATLNGDDASKAVVIDTRTEAQIAASGVAEITSVEQLIDLVINGKHIVRFDGYDKSRWVLGSIFVYDAVKPKANSMYYLPSYAVHGENLVYTLDGKTESLYLTETSDFTGFVTQVVELGTIKVQQAPGTESFPVDMEITSYVDNTINNTYVVTASTKVIDLTGNGRGMEDDLTGCFFSAALAEDGVTVKTLFVDNAAWMNSRDALLAPLMEAKPTLDACPDGHEGWTAISNSSKLTELADGKYYLAEDVTYGSDTVIAISGNVTLCLNGHTLKGQKTNFLDCASGSTLNLCDCSAGETGKLTNTAGYAIRVKGTLNLFSGSITGCTTSFGVVNINVANATFNMLGGKIYGNTATTGSAVYLDGASTVFNMYAGEIIGGAENYAILDNNKKAGKAINMIGGTIRGDNAKACVYLRGTDGAVTVFGGTIENTNSASAVYIKTDNSVTMYGGTLSGGTTVVLREGTTTFTQYAGTVNAGE